MHAVKPSGRMAAGILASLTATSLALGGCAVRPVPEQVTSNGYDTYAIVTGIRCETRQAIFNELLRILSEPDSRVSKEVVERIRSGGPEGVLEKESFDGVPQNTQAVLLPYANFAVVYDFKLDMSVQNNVNAALGIGDVFLARTFTGDISGKSNRKRSNIRQFRTSDTVEGLFREHMGKICERHFTRRKTSPTRIDYQYPITGSIGVDEIVHTFWRLNRDTYLKTDKGASVGTLFADQIEFRTEIEASVTPDPPPLKWSALKYGFWSLKEDGHGETTQARRDCRQAAAG